MPLFSPSLPLTLSPSQVPTRQCHLFFLLASLATIILQACAPMALTIGLGPADRKLKEQTVLQDAGGSSKVALIDVRGLIIDAKLPGFFGEGDNPVDDLVARLAKAEQDSSVKAVVIRINSPGGTVSGSDTMYREVRRFREKSGKPVVASLSEVAASGGYYLALAADKIVAQPTTITGSIGVIIQTVNFSEGLNRIGIHARALKSGPNKDLANPLEPIRDDQYAVLQTLVDEFYARFKGLVIERRTSIKPDLIPTITDGRVVSGAHAVELGLADAQGDLREAFQLAQDLAGLKGATLIKYYDTAGAPKSAYAQSSTDAPRASPTTELNLIQLRLGQSALGPAGWESSGIYYLWLPSE
jgi:protease-4